MRMLKALRMSMGMFSTFPVPKDSWNDAYMPLVIPLFPLVGAAIGGAWYGMAQLLLWLGFPLLIVMALAGSLPFLCSGCLHLDGLMDTADAVFSRKSLEERRRILKDPHAGALAVVAVAFLFVLHFCAFYTVLDAGKALTGLIFLCVVSRAATGIALLNSRPIAETGYMAVFQRGKQAAHTHWLIGVLVAALFAASLFNFTITAACAVELLVAFLVKKVLFQQMQGLSGDLCGAILTASEVCGLLCLAVL